MKNPVRKGKEYVKKIKKKFNKAGLNVAQIPRSGAGDIKGDLWLYFNNELFAVIECKKSERLEIWNYIQQMQREAGYNVGLLIFSRKNEKDYVCLELDDFIEIFSNVYPVLSKQK